MLLIISTDLPFQDTSMEALATTQTKMSSILGKKTTCLHKQETYHQQPIVSIMMKKYEALWKEEGGLGH